MKANNRLGTFSVGTLRFMLSERDVGIIKAIREWRFLTTQQICVLLFVEHASYNSAIRACTRVMGRLHDLKLVARLDRHVGGPAGGSGSFVWAIGAAGDRLLRADPTSGFTKRFRTEDPTPLFLEHTLEVANVRVRLEELMRASSLEILEVQAEPRSWRPFTWSGRPQILKPDLYVVTALDDDEWHRYVEVDRSTESLRVLVDKKARAYEDYAATGADQAGLCVVPQVLWIVPDEARATSFRRALEAAKNITLRLHQIITVDKLEAEFLGQTKTIFPVDRKRGEP